MHDNVMFLSEFFIPSYISDQIYGYNSFINLCNQVCIWFRYFCKVLETSIGSSWLARITVLFAIVPMIMTLVACNLIVVGVPCRYYDLWSQEDKNNQTDHSYETPKPIILNGSKKPISKCYLENVGSSLTADCTMFRNNDIHVLKEHLIKHDKQKHLKWLQRSVLDACFVKLILTGKKSHKKHSLQPIPYYNTLLNLPIPLVPWTSEQCSILKYQPFILLLHKIGFILPGDVGKFFVRIPNFWTADYLFNIADQLGPIDDEFDLNLFSCKKQLRHRNRNDETHSSFTKNKHFLIGTPPTVRYTPCPNSMERFSTVLQSKIEPLTDYHINLFDVNVPELQTLCGVVPNQLIVSNHSLYHNNTEPESVSEDVLLMFHGFEETDYNSMWETASATSDLTRMCVSDEEDKTVNC